MFRSHLAIVRLASFIAVATLFLIANQYGCTPCVDLDGDGYGNPASLLCKHPQLDCDDHNPNVHPGAKEGPYGDPTCNDGLDNDCNDLADSEDPKCVSIGLVEQDFQKIGSGGFGDWANSYVWSMELFNGDLYVGTNRYHVWQTVVQGMGKWAKVFGFDKLFPGPEDQTWGHQAMAEALRAEIWRYRTKPGLVEWKRVHQAHVLYGELPILPNSISGPPPDPPIVGYYPESYGYRAMGSFEGHLYALGIGTFIPSMPFTRVLRSADGEVWEDVSGIIATDTNPRGLAVYQGKLFVSASIPGSGPAGGGQALVYASYDPKVEGWREVSLPGFGNEDNAEIPDLAVFDDHLYASTVNYNTGFEVWKTDGTLDPEDPKGERYLWTQVIKDGFGDTWNQGGWTMKGFGEYLYVGTGSDGGMVFKDGKIVGSRPFDVIRVDRDDNAELVVGADTPSDPPPGWPEFRTPLSGQSAGFGNALNMYVWMMEVHDGWLYLSTFDYTTMIMEMLKVMLPGLKPIFDSLEEGFGGADLWKTSDGINWEPVTVNGFGNPFNVGIRRMLSVGDLLYVGTANGDSPDPGGGCEVWVGHE